MRVSFYTLGCKVNQYETQAIAAQFQKAGFELAGPEEKADVFVVNSCTVTATGDKKTRNRLARFRRENPDAVVVLTGCFPQAFPEKAKALPGIDVVTGAGNKNQIVELTLRAISEKSRIVEIAEHTPDESFEEMQVQDFGEHTRAFVKIQDGCDHYCSYCIIPTARGRVRSKPLEAIRRELSVLAQNGYREVVLVGINLPCYGKDLGLRLIDAAECACSVAGIERVRLGSLEPELLTDEDMMRLAAQPKFCPQFHLSLQSGCDAILRQMNRHYTTGEYLEIVRFIRNHFENPSITTDIIVGFPGESEEHFLQSLAFVREVGFARVHCFPYSRREGTRAAALPGQLPTRVKEERNRRLAAEAERCKTAFLKEQVGRTEEVLLERQREDGSFEGYTKNYTPVRIKGEGLATGQIVSCRLDCCSEEHCLGCAV
ncbi:tRNA (N(6)-L-threonylcarbamoyladenosine(37)-C(2))-methylthiotransferase MtaB [Bittarella massiliensis (ex Durand et al. 2017)]|uniref:tRNA (N(6)-L-threonylcarbamoyladenosine(37)-C(2))- methylthiotransferase MtaB n=1 Tax=Bittarella massiliensis (ex Durand et al. 2017) TaxID=1720313 RepID=UPI001AA1A0E2|nr:tRNA (N(6)-L-threonylcarbamoyladenosine(37)-C(2))-methylthiotransferase MtaB [Bittarella massiliensis (ex Durand et al. 2017)]MBO1678453.1 tRNA (N(6)-L-threonylcarbamoyladenosine(37)-C(2))-methylthiotransferase MtaB [Bittarella massiliensis (ex Durand et al. 2017)]